MQVIFEDPEYREIQRIARAQRMTVAEWVRQALRAARKREPVTDTAKKLATIRSAAQHSFPTAGIGQMLAEIERGYVGPGEDGLR